MIEDQILSTTENLGDERYMRELFDLAVPRLISVIRRAMVSCDSNILGYFSSYKKYMSVLFNFVKQEQSKDAELMLKVKIIVVLFCNTIEEVQFPTIQLSDLLKEIRLASLTLLSTLHHNLCLNLTLRIFGKTHF